MFLGIHVVVCGRAKAFWTETTYSPKSPKTVEFEGRNTYESEKTYVFGYGNVLATEFAPGFYKYDFAVQLLSFLPASFEGTLGNIRYHIEAVLDIPGIFSDKEVIVVPFILARHDDLNEFPLLRTPVQRDEIKLCGMFWGTQPLTMKVTLPQSGYTPGQKIHVTVNYENKSSVQVYRTLISLKRLIRFNR
jgi:hypothetical protein